MISLCGKSNKTFLEKKKTFLENYESISNGHLYFRELILSKIETKVP